jgi:uncharacterized protein (DUF952 family)
VPNSQPVTSARTVYKICSREDWENACAQESYAGSADDKRDGFIHLSTAEQLAGTLAKHFTSRPDLLIIAFATEDLGPDLKWEPSRGGALFPHFYGVMDTNRARSAHPIPLDRSGTHVLPGEDEAS